jgi:L-fuconolactonase
MSMIDSHVHFYDPTRPVGIPWPHKDDVRLYRPRLPDNYREADVQADVSGVIVVEASPWVEDNQWLLSLAAADAMILGCVGNLEVGRPSFARNLKRFSTNSRFRGIRLTHSSLLAGLANSAFIADLELVAQSELTVDLYGPPGILSDVAKLARILPHLRIVIDHCANAKIVGASVDPEWRDDLHAAANSGRVYCKASGLVENTGLSDGTLPVRADFFSPVLDAVCAAFGEDRVIYGSNWPVCEKFAPLATVQSIVEAYFASRGEAASARFFERNVMEAYSLCEKR